MRYFLTLVVFFFQFFILPAQQSIQFILPDQSKTSLYDIHHLNKEWWIGGKEGFVYKVDSAGNMQQVDYGANKNNILSIDHFSENRIILTADSGIFFIGDLRTNAWSKSKIDGIQYGAIYGITIVNSMTAYICGGHSKITKGNKAIPRGFIYKTADGGISWKRIYSSVASMVWDVKYNPLNQKLYALTYSVFNSTLWEITEDDNSIGKKKIFRTKELLHSFDIAENRILIAGGNYFKKNRKGVVYEITSLKTMRYPFENFIWDIKIRPQGFLACSKGNVYFQKNNSMQQIAIGPSSNYYEISEPSGTFDEVIVVGASGSLFKIKF